MVLAAEPSCSKPLKQRELMAELQKAG